MASKNAAPAASRANESVPATAPAPNPTPANQPQEQRINPFVEMEHKWLKHWYDTGVVEQYRSKNDKSEETFSFMDGPITANNPMGVHHAWGRSYKDLWQKFNNLQGKRQRFRNGFDCQGLWVEVEVEKELGLKNKHDIENLVPGDKQASIAKFVQLCKDRVLKFSGIQTQQSQRLGYFMDWDNSYFTMSDDNNYMIWHFLKTCHDHGWIYKGHDSVPWCPRCGTAISQHEMLTEDYAELQHETVFFKLKIVGAKDSSNADNARNGENGAGQKLDFNTGKPVYLLAWTTTPWTVPGNVALAVNPEIDYVLVKTAKTDTQLIVAGSRLKESIKEEYEVLKKIKGANLIGFRYEAPFDDLPRVTEARDKHPDTFHTVVDGTDIVSETEGTGILHVAPGQGQEDFVLGKEEGLSVIELIEEDAAYYDGMGEFSGQNAKVKPGIVFNALKAKNDGEFFYKTMSYKHRYPLCWRCKTELVWRVVDEWYVAMDKKSEIEKDDARTLRERMKDVAKKITWIPSFGLDRELDWLDKMHDWLISKKRFWGLALPIWITEDGTEFEVIGSKDELKERAVEGFDQLDGHSPHRPYVDAITIKSKETGRIMHRVVDVGNVWLDAGIVPYSTIQDPETGEPAYYHNKEYFKQWFPVDFITESFPGQFKNWFYSMIAMSTVLEDTNPYKTVLGYATLLAEDGRAMHKSWGNSIEFNEGADIIGVDVMRWMFARQNPTDNALFGYRKADEVRRMVYIPLWNVYKFFMEYSAADKIDCRTLNSSFDAIKSDNVLDTWIASRAQTTIMEMEAALKKYDARVAAAAAEGCIDDLSTWYVRRSRDRVGAGAPEGADKTAFYETLYAVLVNMSVALSPFMPFITEEMYTTLTGRESVHLASWPKIDSARIAQDVLSDMQVVRDIVEVGHRVRKENKLKVRQPLAMVTALVPEDRPISGNHNDQYLNLILAELNVKKIWAGKDEKRPVEEITVEYDTTLTPELIMEGKLRDLIRAIQGERKKMGAKMDQKVDLVIPEEFKAHEDEIRKATLVGSLDYGAELKVS
jgi:isoleucyl-tRNA synthetase